MATRPLTALALGRNASFPGTEKTLASHPHIVGLDAVRSVAAVVVMLFHYDAYVWQATGRGLLGGNSVSLLSIGWVGVQIFFVLSGFVIAYSLAGNSAGEFFKRRFFRLWPAMLLCSTLCALLELTDHGSPHYGEVLSRWKHSVLFQSGLAYIDGSHWTLPIEIQFYSLVFLLLLFRRGKDLWPVMTLSGLLSSVYCCFLAMSLRPSLHIAKTLIAHTNFFVENHVGLLRHGCYFALGVGLQFLVTGARRKIHLLPIAFFVAGACCEIAVRCHDMQDMHILTRSPAWSIGAWVLVVASVVGCVHWNSGIAALLGRRGGRTLRLAGLMTYPAYLTHQSVGHFMMFAIGSRVGLRAALFLSVGIVMGIAYGITVYMEPPLGRQLRALTSNKSTTTQRLRKPLQWRTT